MGHFYRPTTFQGARYLSLVIPFLSSWHRNNTCPHGCYSLGAACVDVEASFAHPMSLSKPQVHPDLPDAPPLPLPSFSDRGFPQLLTFLHSHLDSHIRAVQHADTFDDIFATFVVGPQDHHNAGAALHSHLVGCATTDPRALPTGPP